MTTTKIKDRQHQKAVRRGEIEKLGMADHTWKEKRDEVDNR